MGPEKNPVRKQRPQKRDEEINKEATIPGESVQSILSNEGIPPSIVQFGGQTGMNLARALARANYPILGTSAESIDLAEDRASFQNLLERLGIPQPPGASARTTDEALTIAHHIGYPVLARPSYVIGGHTMEIVQNEEDLRYHLREISQIPSESTILIDKYLEGTEVEVDAVSDGKNVLIPGIMEHIEQAGVHSGDSIAVYPPISLSTEEIDTLIDYTRRISQALNIRGLINVQYVITRNSNESTAYVIEANPRASRTVPFIAKATGVPMVMLATKAMLGVSLTELGYKDGLWPSQKLVAVKVPVFSMSKLEGVDSYLGPEMKSTGEVMGIDYTFEAALFKALLAAGISLPRQGNILLSLSDRTKPDSQPLIRQLMQSGYKIFATEGTAAMIKDMQFKVETVLKPIGEGHPNAVDIINDGVVDAVINTPEGKQVATLKDGFYIRRAAIGKRIPCFTSLNTARVVIEIMLMKEPEFTVQPVKEYRTSQSDLA